MGTLELDLVETPAPVAAPQLQLDRVEDQPATDNNGDVAMKMAHEGSEEDGHTTAAAGTTWNTVAALRGVVKMDPKSTIADGAWSDGLAFLAHPDAVARSVSDSTTTSARALPSVPGFTEGGYLSYTGGEIRRNTKGARRSKSASSTATSTPTLQGQLRIVSSRTVVRSRPDAKAIMRRRCSRPAIFRTTQEADQITAAHKRSIAPFLSRNLGLPDGPSTLICEYWSERPSPLFDFCPGDVCLTSVMPGRGFMNDTISSVLIARRRWVED